MRVARRDALPEGASRDCHHPVLIPSPVLPGTIAGYTSESAVVVDKNVVTSQGPGTSALFALKLVEVLVGRVRGYAYISLIPKHVVNTYIIGGGISPRGVKGRTWGSVRPVRQTPPDGRAPFRGWVGESGPSVSGHISHGRVIGLSCVPCGSISRTSLGCVTFSCILVTGKGGGGGAGYAGSVHGLKA
jgi:hypothetical protein